MLSGESVTLMLAGNNVLLVSAIDAAGNHAEASEAFNVLGVALITPVADTFVRHSQPNQPMGAEEYLRLSEAGRNRILLRFDTASFLASLPAGVVIEQASLKLSIESNADNWGSSGRAVGIHRMIKAWTEQGATWNCTIDSNTANQKSDCSESMEWEMGKPNNPELHPWIDTPSDTMIVTNDSLGILAFDVTTDLAGMFNGSVDYGWIVMKEDEERTGRLTFFGRETAAPSNLRVVYRME